MVNEWFYLDSDKPPSLIFSVICDDMKHTVLYGRAYKTSSGLSSCHIMLCMI